MRRIASRDNPLFKALQLLPNIFAAAVIAFVGWVAIGAMQADHAVELLRERTLVITPGDREDLVRAAIDVNRHAATPRVIGLVLTGGFRPTDAVIDEMRRADMFAYLVGTDTYRTAQAVAKHLYWVDALAIGAVMTVWTAVLTVAIGCWVVMVMKGPHYAADSYPLNDAPRPRPDKGDVD